MEKTKSIKAEIIINSSKESVWETLFTRFGETFVFNPNLESSHFTNGSPGEIGCERQCNLNTKIFVREKIVKAEPANKFTVDVIGGNMPMVDKMRVEFELIQIGNNRTRVSLQADISTKPSFMSLLTKGPFKKKLTDMLIGLKYYLETGKRVSKKIYKPIYKQYQQLQLNQSF